MQRWGQQKRFREGARDVEERKSNRQCSLATVGNLLLPEARDSEELKNQLILLGHIGYDMYPALLTVCIITFDTA